MDRWAVASTPTGGAAPVRTQRFTTTVADGGRGRALIPVPFDPDTVWGAKPRHHVTGTVGGVGVRGVVQAAGGGHGFTLGVAWLRDCAVAVGDTVTVEIAAEGPQRADLADDLAAALAADPAAGAFFDGLAQFHRRAYLRWIDGATRRPQLRAQRIAEMIALLDAGVKQRPKP
jgi:hypothetical protein